MADTAPHHQGESGMTRVTWRDTLQSWLAPMAKLVSETTYLRLLKYCFEHCLPACRPILYFYRAAVGFQLTPAEIVLLLPYLRQARNFLVFGVGRDTRLWVTLGPSRTFFIEHDPLWIDRFGQWTDHIHRVAYRTELSRYADYLSEPDFLELATPAAVTGIDWDLVLVDAPPGYMLGTPGRMQSICAASQLVRPGGVVMVHDVDREAEQLYTTTYLGPERARAGCLGKFHAVWEIPPPFVAKDSAEQPAPAEPQRRTVSYFRDDRLDITVVILEEGMRLGFRNDREVLLVRDPWYPDDVIRSVTDHASLNRLDFDRVHYLSNTQEIHLARLSQGLNSHFINIGCFVDGDGFRPDDANAGKLYDAVMIARYDWHNDDQIKRHFLASDVPRLALLDPGYGSSSTYYRDFYVNKPNCTFANSARLGRGEVTRILRQSHCGLILSSLEGVCRASSEYLLCGLPVVSTASVGGRDVWYDDYNSIIVDDDAAAVADAVMHFVNNPRDPWRIRSDYLRRAARFRQRFVEEVLEPVFQRFGVPRDPRSVGDETPFPWWPEDRPG